MEVKPKEVGQRIRLIRLEKGLSMSAFAERIDNKAKSGTVSNWETGKNLPNNERLKRISELGKLSIDELLYGKSKDYEMMWFSLKEELEKRVDKYQLVPRITGSFNTTLNIMNKLEEEN